MPLFNGLKSKVATNNTAPPAAVEEEWKEIEVERKDYSGLKIGQLTINEDDLNQRDEAESYDDDENEGNENYQMSDSKGNGPWKKVIPAEEVTQIPMPAVGPATGASFYISPSLRNSVSILYELNSILLVVA